MKIATIIVTYNAMKWIDWCIGSLKKSTANTTVIIVDNCSTDGTRQYVPAHYPEAVWMPQERNLGFGQANNKGMRYALDNGFDAVLLLNQDAALKEDALELLANASDGRSLVAPVQLNGNGTALDAMFRVSLKISNNLLFDDLLIRKETAPIYEFSEIGAACWFMPINLIKTIGGFNPIFFHYGEDNNYYQRLVYHNIKTILVPDAHMYHDRILYGNINVYNNKRLKRDLLLGICNINYKKMKTIIYIIKVFVHHYNLSRNKLKYILEFNIEIFNIMLMYTKITSSKKVDRTLGTNWL